MKHITQECLDYIKDKFDYWGNGITAEDIEEFSDFLKTRLNTERKLYRYSPADYYNIRNFETGKLKLTSNGQLNDVYEGLPISAQRQPTIEDVKALDELAYIKCFSVENNNNLMWSHYAENHTGICVEYDLSMLDKNHDYLNHIYPVLYSEKRHFAIDLDKLLKEQKQLLSDIYADNEPDSSEYLINVPLLLLFKGTEWNYEKEWRIIYTKRDMYLSEDPDLNNGIIHFDCISGIYFGYLIRPEIRQNLIEIVRRQNKFRKKETMKQIDLYDMCISNSTYELSTKKIKEACNDE